jgi:predicted ATPase
MRRDQALRLTRVRLRNWRNFVEAEVRLGRRAFLVGPNASGKSNFLDALRFLRDVARPEGGLQWALTQPGRGDFKHVRCLFARRPSDMVFDVDVGTDQEPTAWRYLLEVNQQRVGSRTFVTVKRERVERAGTELFDARRPASDVDWLSFTQTRLEQVQRNQDFRELAAFFTSMRYLHLVPQIVRDPRRHLVAGDDPFGGDLLLRIKATPKKSQEPRLKRLKEALSIAVPNFVDLRLEDDEGGRPHLQADFQHWRPHPTIQTEEFLSDGSLRLVGFLWSVLERGGPLLLEEPELSLHEEVVAQLPLMLDRMQRQSGRQVIASTHARAMIDAPGVGLHEVHRIIPERNGSRIETAADNKLVAEQVGKYDWPMSQAVLPLTVPPGIDRLARNDLVSD